jgi:hypothetical protein
MDTRTLSTVDQNEELPFDDHPNQKDEGHTLHNRYLLQKCEEDDIMEDSNLLITSNNADVRASYSLQHNRTHSTKVYALNESATAQTLFTGNQIVMICVLVLGLILVHDVWLVWLASKFFVSAGDKESC